MQCFRCSKRLMDSRRHIYQRTRQASSYVIESTEFGAKTVESRISENQQNPPSNWQLGKLYIILDRKVTLDKKNAYSKSQPKPTRTLFQTINCNREKISSSSRPSKLNWLFVLNKLGHKAQSTQANAQANTDHSAHTARPIQSIWVHCTDRFLVWILHFSCFTAVSRHLPEERIHNLPGAWLRLLCHSEGFTRF